MSGGGSGTTTSTQVNYSPEEAAQRAQVMAEANRIYGTTAPQITNAPYPGSVPVGPSAATQWGQNTALANSQYIEPSINNLMNSVNYSLGGGGQTLGLQPGLQQSLGFSLRDVLYPGSNPALQQYMQAAIRPVTQSYMDPGGIMSQIRTQAGEANQVGSSRQGVAEGIAAGRYGQAVGDTAAKVANTAYGQGLQAMGQAQGTLAGMYGNELSAMGRAQALAPGAMQALMLPAEMRSAVGSQQEAYAQMMNDYLANSRMWDLNAPWTPLQNYANIVFGGASPGTSATSESSGGSSNRLSGALGGGLAGFTALGPMGAIGGALLGALMS